MGDAARQEPWKRRQAKLFARAFNLGEARNTLKDNEGDLGKHALMDARIIDWHADPGSFVDLQDHCRCVPHSSGLSELLYPWDTDVHDSLCVLQIMRVSTPGAKGSVVRLDADASLVGSSQKGLQVLSVSVYLQQPSESQISR